MFKVTKKMLETRINEFNVKFNDTLGLQTVYQNHYNLVRFDPNGGGVILQLLIPMKKISEIDLYFSGYSNGKQNL